MNEMHKTSRFADALAALDQMKTTNFTRDGVASVTGKVYITAATLRAAFKTQSLGKHGTRKILRGLRDNGLTVRGNKLPTRGNMIVEVIRIGCQQLEIKSLSSFQPVNKTELKNHPLFTNIGHFSSYDHYQVSVLFRRFKRTKLRNSNGQTSRRRPGSTELNTTLSSGHILQKVANKFVKLVGSQQEM